MHLYVMSRGIKHDVDRWVNDMSAQYFPFKYDNQDMAVQLAMRPIQFWEIVLPKGGMPQVCKTLFGTNETAAMPRKELKVPFAAIRKCLGARKIPKFDEKIQPRILYKNNVAIYPIGIKDDKQGVHGEEL